ncbi:MAG: TauD/TfdA family dioxygenase [Acidimicrobiia bacterium]|nr:TauD/TfdA family dioxygenase [Acidimicrobiia bacterium]
MASLPEDLRAAAAAVEPNSQTLSVEWNDGHHSRYKIADLLLLSDQALGRRPPLAPVTHFAADHRPATFVMAEPAWGSVAHHDLLDAVTTGGFAVVDRMEPSDDTTEQLARLLGPVRETDFGRFFDIITEPVAWTLSQSAKGQDPHSDDPYRYTPSGISILHCRQAAEGWGGTSILVDGMTISGSSTVAPATRTTPPADAT